MEYKDYYKILGVDRGADDKAVKTAYRKLARKYHPDVNKGNADRFKEINEAYDVLSDPEKRQRYDALGADWNQYTGAPPSGSRVTVETGDLGDFSEFFRSIFGDLGAGRGWGRVRDFRRGGSGVTVDVGPFGGFGDDVGAGVPPREGAPRQDAEMPLDLTLEEAFAGTRKTINAAVEEPCATCGGSGSQGRQPCPKCRGTGWQRSQRHLDVKIPAGIDTGQRVRVAGEGPRGMGGGPGGDLYLVITVAPHPRFERKQGDLYVDLPVSAPDAALGAEVSVPTLRGQVSMKIPPETSGGRTFRLPGYGMPRLRGTGSGDQYVRVQVTIPSGLGPREKELYGELQRLRGDKAR